jgi:hypothetical protein
MLQVDGCVYNKHPFCMYSIAVKEHKDYILRSCLSSFGGVHELTMMVVMVE